MHEKLIGASRSVAVLLAVSLAAALAVGSGRARATAAPEARNELDLSAADLLLHQERWERALAELHDQEKQLAAQPEHRGAWLARVAVAEEGMGRGAEAAWDWAVANELGTGIFSTAELAAFGKPGERLMAHQRREIGAAPAGTEIPLEGSDVQHEVKRLGVLPSFGNDVWAPREWMRIEVVVDESGRLRDPRLLSARSGEAAYLALAALRTWQFEPATLQGRPVAVLHTLVVNAPGQLPLGKIMQLSAESASIEGLLRRQQWSAAEPAADEHWHALLDSAAAGGGPGAERAALGLTLAFRALAEAAAEPSDKADWRCRWEAAQALLPGLFDLDLTSYGHAGEVVSAWRQATFKSPYRAAPVYRVSTGADGGGLKVTKPERLDAEPPYFPKAAKKLHLEDRVILKSVIDAEGRITHPAILSPVEPGAAVSFAASALDAVCGWRFKPAMLDEKPVSVFYNLTVNFEIRPH